MSSPLARWHAWWDALHEEHSDFIDRMPQHRIRLAVFAASALTLYTEMVMVRWHSTCFHAFAVFKNVSLLSCFLGLAIGYGLSRRRRITLAGFLPLLAVQAVLFSLLSSTNIGGRKINPVAELLVMGQKSAEWSWLDAVEGNGFLAAVFVLNAVMFIPLGHLAGRLMSRLERIESYSLNLLGSLAGIAAFFALSLVWSGPAVWMGLVALAVAPFLVGHRKTAAVSVASMALVLTALGVMGDHREQTYYSPYQVISLRLPDLDDAVPHMTVRVNHCFFQDIMDCRPSAVALSRRCAKAAAHYGLPYQLQTEPGDVLIVGAGTGNDVAAALRHEARSVTAVEIDPTIVYLGRRLHPERPYQDARTKVLVNDARTFLRQTDERFDTIVYGLLDSHTNLGAMTNVRLDSFVYTVEGFRDAVHRLNSDGLLVVTYMVLDPKQGDKLFAMLQQAYPDATPRAFQGKYMGTTFVTGPGLRHIPNQIADVPEVTAEFLAGASDVEVATDDWPFFYMQSRTYPVTYAVMIAILLALSAWIVKRNLAPKSMVARPNPLPPGGGAPSDSLPPRGGGLGWGGSRPNLSPPPQPSPISREAAALPLKGEGARKGAFFFLGAGFMLIETKGITQLGLVWGNTWSVVAITITAILVMVYLANHWVLRRGPVPQGLSFALLGAALLSGWALTALSGSAVPAAKLVMPVALTLPLFFAGLIFSSQLARGGEIGAALSANLFGAMLGGFLEYNSMYWGYASLYPLGMSLYAAACACMTLANRRPQTETPAAPVHPPHLVTLAAIRNGNAKPK